MTGPVTVIGLVQGGCLLEDIRITVPQRMAIQIPAHLAERSQSLLNALQQRQVMRLGTAATVAKEVPAQLNTSLRGRGIGPLVAITRREPAPPVPSEERELLVLELEASREECRRSQALNESLQATLQTMAQQLGKIQRAVETLTLRAGSFPPLAALSPAVGGGMKKAEAVPHFIPPTTLEVAEVRINPSETTSTSNTDEAVAALRSLRGKPA